MSHTDSLKQLLRPLGVYQLEGSINGAELESVGSALDVLQNQLELLHREADLTTAEGEGLEAWLSLLARRPVAENPEQLRAAAAALLRVGGDSFTLKAINDNLLGCGINAVAAETETPQTVSVSFPQVPGIPDGFEELCAIIEDILPCHLAVEYLFWYITWAIMEQRFATWSEVEALHQTWQGLEKLVI